jgi:penicillin amidase
VIIGHNRRIAWGVTNLGFDVQDLYREQIDLQTGRYLYQGQVQQARLERDTIAVKGAKSIETAVWITRHGPILVSDENRSYSMRWMAAEPGALSTFPFLDLDRAGDWDQFNAVLEKFAGPAQNFVYADIDGNIGYHAAGRLPQRGACAPDVPLDGSSGDCEWQGFIPYDQLPSVFNPPSGVIVTANQNPFPADYPSPVDGRFAPSYRAREIRARLDSRAAGWKPEEMLAVQKDVYSALADFLARQAVAAWDKHPDSRTREAVGLLRGWNGQMEKGTPQPMIVGLLLDELRNAIADRAAPGKGKLYETSFLAPETVERILRERPADWFPDYDALLTRSLATAIAAGQKSQGSKLSRWDYGVFNRLTVQNPVIGQVPLIGKYFNIGPVSMSGSPTTIKQTSRRLGPSFRMVVDLSNLDASLANITTGESGHELSRHYMDQWNAYYGGRSFPMQFDRVDASSVLNVSPR